MFVVGTFLGFTVNVDLFTATVFLSAVHGRTSASFSETSAAGFICFAGIFTGNLDVTSGTEFMIIIDTFCCTAI